MSVTESMDSVPSAETDGHTDMCVAARSQSGSDCMHERPPTPVPYCPWHEYDWTECCFCCVARRRELRRIDNELRTYWYRAGYDFADRGRINKQRRAS